MPAYTDTDTNCPQTISYKLETSDPVTIDSTTNPGFVRVVPNTLGVISLLTFIIKV